MLTILSGHINYVTNNKIYLICLDTLPDASKAIGTITEKDLTEALKKTACKLTSIAAAHPAPRAYSKFLWTCEYSVGRCLLEVGVATITKVPVGLDKFRFVLRVYKYLYQRTQLHILDYEEAGPVQQLTEVPNT